ncbi:MAG: hypothetical protein LBS27_04080 [Bifidobacteriaceae bacterium]|jgi:hypothetical protein|nr:hypothetical protein [Bifidobacteriaceae bacterium]
MQEDATTLAYLNLHAVLGAIENLTALVPAARRLATTAKPVSVGFAVRGGPAGTLAFDQGLATFRPGAQGCDVKLPFSSPAKLNAMVDGKGTAIPSRGLTKISFLTKQFVPLTGLLEQYLRPAPEALADPEFFKASTEVMFYVIAAALSQVANHDQVGRFSADHTVDGDIDFGVAGGPRATIRVRGHRFETVKEPCASPRAVMEFESLGLARQLFDGEVVALACIGTGQIAMRGMISMLDNLNRILDRVAVYLG